jgi:phosphotriesterase-related protein
VVLGPNEEADIIDDLLITKSAGLTILADLSVPGSGRDVAALARISKRVDLPVIAATGFYWDPFPQAVYDMSRKQLAAAMIDEIASGAEGTTFRCGVIKIGTPRGTPGGISEHLFCAAVDAAEATGAAIITHTSEVAQASWQIKFLRECNFDPARTLVSHFGKASLDQVFEAADAGVYLGIDQIGFESGPSYEQLAQLVSTICKRGYERQLILSSDMARRTRLHRFGGTSYGTVFTQFLPHLRQAGLPERQIEVMLKDNPARLFTISNPAAAQGNQSSILKNFRKD